MKEISKQKMYIENIKNIFRKLVGFCFLAVSFYLTLVLFGLGRSSDTELLFCVAALPSFLFIVFYDNLRKKLRIWSLKGKFNRICYSLIIFIIVSIIFSPFIIFLRIFLGFVEATGGFSN